MKRLFFSIALAAIMGLSLMSCQNDLLDLSEDSVFGTNATSMMQTRAVTNYTVGDVVGNYSGELDTVIMNGNPKNPVSGRTVTISANSEPGKFNLHLPPFQVGNMPGTIEIKANGITLNADGTFSATNLSEAVILTFSWGVQRSYPATLVSGSFTQTATGYELEFGVNSQGTFGIITVFTAYVHFTGSK